MEPTTFNLSGCTHLEHRCPNVTDVIRHKRICVSESKRTTIWESGGLHFAIASFRFAIPY